MQTYRIHQYVCGAVILACFGIGAVPSNAEPPSGPAPAGGGADARKATPAEAAAAAEAERQRALSDAVTARDQADLTRAAYEKANKPGKATGPGKGAFDEVVSAYAKAIDRPLGSPEVIKVVSYCHLRLGGAYEYVGEFDKAVEQCKKAAAASAGTAGELEATYSVGLVYLQALHDPKEALMWMKRVHELTQTKALDPETQGKWIAVSDEAIRRCEQEAKN